LTCPQIFASIIGFNQSIKQNKSANKTKCPSCGSTNIARILYGYPLFSDKLDKDLKSGKVVLGGCCRLVDDPDRHCNDCEKRFLKYPSTVPKSN